MHVQLGCCWQPFETSSHSPQPECVFQILLLQENKKQRSFFMLQIQGVSPGQCWVAETEEWRRFFSLWILSAEGFSSAGLVTG